MVSSRVLVAGCVWGRNRCWGRVVCLRRRRSAGGGSVGCVPAERGVVSSGWLGLAAAGVCLMRAGGRRIFACVRAWFPPGAGGGFWLVGWRGVSGGGRFRRWLPVAFGGAAGVGDGLFACGGVGLSGGGFGCFRCRRGRFLAGCACGIIRWRRFSFLHLIEAVAGLPVVTAGSPFLPEGVASSASRTFYPLLGGRGAGGGSSRGYSRASGGLRGRADS